MFANIKARAGGKKEAEEEEKKDVDEGEEQPKI
jgi:hypothetical protein